MISNIVMNRSPKLGPGRVSGVDILGSNSTATLCNSHTTGNIVMMAAGENRCSTGGCDMSIGTNMSLLSAKHLRVVGSRRLCSCRGS